MDSYSLYRILPYPARGEAIAAIQKDSEKSITAFYAVFSLSAARKHFLFFRAQRLSYCLARLAALARCS